MRNKDLLYLASSRPDSGKILAVDFGKSSVGIAVSDDGRMLSFGRGVLKDYKSLVKLFAAIQEICKKEQVKEIVVGLPLGENGESTSQTERIRRIGNKLADFLINMPIFFEDESFSSYEADQFLAHVGVKPLQRKASEDEMAAIIILQRYLERKKA